MDRYSLHPFPDTATRAYLDLIERSRTGDASVATENSTPFWFRRLVSTSNPKPNDVSFGFVAWLATQQPSFAATGLGLSPWEARIDRGSGMLLRPPSRLFVDAGLDVALARRMPIRIAAGDTMMAGAWVPPRAVDAYAERLDRLFDRSIRRLVDAELDAVTMMGLMTEAVTYARDRGMGLIEAIDLIDPTDARSWPTGANVIARPTDRALVARIEEATRPPKQPGLIRRLLGFGRS